MQNLLSPNTNLKTKMSGAGTALCTERISKETCPSPRFAGDWLLNFSGGSEAFPRRDRQAQPDEQVEFGSPVKLSIHPSTARWRGLPLIVVKEANYQAWLFGEVFGVARDHSTIQRLLRDVIDEGTFAEELNGHYLLLARNYETRQWHLWTNRFGTVHAYYARDGKRAALGTFAPAVAAAASRRRLDWLGLTGFFAFGFFPQDRTHFEDVRILRPASHYVFDDNGAMLRQERYWQWQHRPNERRSYDDTLAEFADTLEEVLSDQTSEGRIAVPISGGLDSRTTVAVVASPVQASTARDRFWSYSYGYADDSIETRIARQVAGMRHLPFQSFTIQPYLFDKLNLVTASVEGFQDVTQCRQASICEDLASHADYVIAAHWGDVWLDDAGLVGEKSATSDNKAILSHVWHKIAKEGRAWLLENFQLPGCAHDDPERILRRTLQEELSQVAHLEDADFRVKAFKSDQWSFRWTTASLRMFQPGALPRLPFYDTRMADFLFTVPSEFMSGRKLQIDYLKRFAADLARVPWQTYDANLFHYKHFNSWLLPKRAMKKAWRTARGNHVIERNWEIQFLNNSGRQGLAKWLLRRGLRLHEFVDPKAIHKLLDDFYLAPLERKRGYTVSMLLTFSVWLEQYG